MLETFHKHPENFYKTTIQPLQNFLRICGEQFRILNKFICHNVKQYKIHC